MRDIKERGRNLDQVLDQYTTLVKPAFEEFTLPVCFWRPHCCEVLILVMCVCSLQTKKYADIIIPRGSENIG